MRRRAGGRAPSERRNDPAPVGIQGLFLRVVHEVDREVIAAQRAQARELGDMVLDPAEHAETIDDVVGNEVRGRIPRAAVVGVVVVPALLDVVGERARNAPRLLAVAPDEIGDMVAHHAPEPAELLALVRDVVPHVGGGGDTGRDRVRRAPRRGRRLPDRAQGPLENPGIRELQDEAVRVPADAVQRPGTVSGAPHREVEAPVEPGEAQRGAPVLHALPRDQALDHPHGLGHLGESARLASDVAQGRVAPADAADRPRPVDIVQRREGRCEHRPVARAGIGHHRTHHDPLGLGQDPRQE